MVRVYSITYAKALYNNSFIVCYMETSANFSILLLSLYCRVNTQNDLRNLSIFGLIMLGVQLRTKSDMYNRCDWPTIRFYIPERAETV